MNKFSVVDLFAGAGGLSLGFEQTQKYEIKVAFENNPPMQETYRMNHPNADVRGDVCAADYSEIQNQYGAIDVVIGGPPCQGFSNANRQKNHAISKNNMLVKQYVRAITELQPKAFVMENVSMLKSDVHRFFLEKRDVQTVEEYGIPIRPTTIHLLDPQFIFPAAAAIVQDLQLIKQYLWDKSDYVELNVIYKASKNAKKAEAALEKHKKRLLKITERHLVEYAADDAVLSADSSAFSAVRDFYAGKTSAENVQRMIEPAVMIQRMLSKAMEVNDNKIVVDRYSEENGLDAIIRSYAVYDYIRAILGSEKNGYVINSRVLCAADYGAPQKRMRFVLIGIKKNISDKAVFPNGQFDEDEYRTVRDAIGDLEDIEPVYDLEDDKGITLPPVNTSALGSALRNSPVLHNHIVTKTTDIALERFRAIKQGQNFHSLDDTMKTNTYTDADRTQNTIYLRLNYDEPSGTVVNVRKSMWIHPVKNRAISVREAARLQTFPDSFVFCGSKDQQYQQVGNAVPPIMAKSVAKKLAKLLSSGTSDRGDESAR